MMKHASTVSRSEGPGGYVIHRTTITRSGILAGDESYQYVTTDSNYAVGSVLSLRTTWLNGEMVTDPEKAKALWQEAAWL
jgi:hypothetical protein